MTYAINKNTDLKMCSSKILWGQLFSGVAEMLLGKISLYTPFSRLLMFLLHYAQNFTEFDRIKSISVLLMAPSHQTDLQCITTALRELLSRYDGAQLKSSPKNPYIRFMPPELSTYSLCLNGEPCTYSISCSICAILTILLTSKRVLRAF